MSQWALSETGREAAAMDAVRAIAGRGQTNLATAILEGLGLIDGEGNIRPDQSLYAGKYLELLEKKPEKQVVNRGELIEPVGTGVTGTIEKDIPFKLEPEWSAVILLALVYNGNIVLNLGGQDKLDANNIERAAIIALADLIDFRFYARPTEMPLARWVQVFEGLGLGAGKIRSDAPQDRKDAVERLQETVQAELNRVATLQGRLHQGLQLWNHSLFTDRQLISERGVVENPPVDQVSLPHDYFTPQLRHYKNVLETLSRFNTVGKLRNLRLTAVEINDAMEARKVLDRVDGMSQLVDRIQPMTAYLGAAEAGMPEDHPWAKKAAAIRSELLNQVRRLARGDSGPDAQAIRQDLERLKQEYVGVYAEMHRESVLGPNEDEHRQQLYKDPRRSALESLVEIELLAPNRPELDGWSQALTGLRTCTAFHEGLLADSPTCTCNFRPAQDRRSQEAADTLNKLDERLSAIMLRWQQALRASLNSETVLRSIDDMTPAEQAPLKQFLDQPDDDPRVPAGLVQSAAQALQGIDALALPVDALIETLKLGGLPCTVTELKARFNRFVDEQMRGHDAGNTRLTLEE